MNNFLIVNKGTPSPVHSTLKSSTTNVNIAASTTNKQERNMALNRWSWALLGVLMIGSIAAAEDIRVYVGTYTRGESKGIYSFTLDSETGMPSKPNLAAELVNPSFVAISPDQRFLFAVNEVSEPSKPGGRGVGGVTSFKLDKATGELNKINSQVSGGGAPCHLCVDASGANVLVANYTGGSVACLPVQKDGTLGEVTSLMQHAGSSVDPRRQKGPHAHSVNLDAMNKFAMVADLGLDQILVYELDAVNHQLLPNSPKYVETGKGYGPRHLSFHPDGNYVYSNNEMTSSVTAYSYDSEAGVLKPLHTVPTQPAGDEHPNNSTAEALVHPSGKFVYVSNRGHNSIAIFHVRENGMLTAAGHTSTQGKIPRNFGITPSGEFLLAANQDSASVVVFRIDGKTGALTPTGGKVEIPNPVCVRFLK